MSTAASETFHSAGSAELLKANNDATMHVSARRRFDMARKDKSHAARLSRKSS
jgi:hypothetical protein